MILVGVAQTTEGDSKEPWTLKIIHSCLTFFV